jgi:hypothetical protein
LKPLLVFMRRVFSVEVILMIFDTIILIKKFYLRIQMDRFIEKYYSS